MAYTEVTVVGTYLGPDGTPLEGRQVRFSPNVPAVKDSDGNTVIVRGEGIIVTLDATGSFSQDLAATDDANLTPTGWSWKVREFFEPNRSWYLPVPAATVGTLNIADVTQYEVAPDLITYPSKTDFDTHVAKTANVHGVTDMTVLETQTGAQTKVNTHAAVTTGAHGIPDPTTIVVTTDARLTNARPPTGHAGNHAAAGGDPLTPAAIGAAAAVHTHLAANVTDLGGAALLDVGTTAGAVAAGDAPAAAQAAAQAYTDAEIVTHSAASDPHGDRAAASGALAAHVVASDPHGDRAAASDDLAAHVAAADPHGDRSYAAGIVAAHAVAADPHADRAFATGAVSTHAAASDPHGDRAYTDGVAGAHVIATDPHGDRAYADAQVAASAGTASADLAAHAADSTSVHGIADTSALETTTGSAAKVSAHAGASDPHGDRAAASAALSAHTSATTSVHGIADTSALETTTGSAAKVSAHAVAADPHGDRAFATSAASSAVSTHAAAVDPHGDRAFATSAVSAHVSASDPHSDRSYADGILATHAADTTSVHGITDTSALETTTGSTSKVSAHAVAADPHGDRAYSDGQLSTHAADTTSVHGIADTSLLETTSGATAKVSAHTAASDPHGDRSYADGIVSAHAADSTSVHGIADTAALQTTSACTAAINNHAVASDPHADRAYTDAQVGTRVPTTRTVTAGTGLTGGGALSSNITLNVAYGTSAGTACQGNDSRLSGNQPLDSDLTAVAGLVGTGLMARLGDGAAAVRTVTAGSTKVTVSNGDGGLGNPTVDVAPANFTGIPQAGVTNLVTDLAAKADDSAVIKTTGDQTKSGVLTLSSHPLISAGGSAGAGSQKVATELYIQARTDNLLSNGSGLLGNNTNFATFAFDSVETYGGGGSFRANTANGLLFSDEYIPVNPDRYYRLLAMVKCGDIGGGNFNAANVQYCGVALYDIDRLAIAPQMAQRFPGATDTTLALQLNPGDSTMTVTNAAGWHSGAVTSSRYLGWWPYTNSLGYTYADYTYTRNVLANAWGQGGITGNVVTLNTPWAGPTLAPGTKVRNCTSVGGTYKYCTNLTASAVPNSWTSVSGYIGTMATPAGSTVNNFWVGTSYVRPTFLVNYHGAADNNVRYSMLYFGTATARNLETATATVPGVVTAPATSVPGVVTVPASASATGVAGQIAYDASYVYICVSTNTWKRSAIAGW